MKHAVAAPTETPDKMPRVKRGEEKHNLEILCLLRNEIMCNVLGLFIVTLLLALVLCVELCTADCG